MKYILFMLLVSIGCVQTAYSGSDIYFDTTVTTKPIVQWGKNWYVEYVDEQVIDTATTNIVWDSLGYLKISRVFRMGFTSIRIWQTHIQVGGIRFNNGYDSVWYLKDNKLFKEPVLMEFTKGQKQ